VGAERKEHRALGGRGGRVAHKSACGVAFRKAAASLGPTPQGSPNLRRHECRRQSEDRCGCVCFNVRRGWGGSPPRTGKVWVEMACKPPLVEGAVLPSPSEGRFVSGLRGGGWGGGGIARALLAHGVLPRALPVAARVPPAVGRVGHGGGARAEVVVSCGSRTPLAGSVPVRHGGGGGARAVAPSAPPPRAAWCGRRRRLRCVAWRGRREQVARALSRRRGAPCLSVTGGGGGARAVAPSAPPPRAAWCGRRRRLSAGRGGEGASGWLERFPTGSVPVRAERGVASSGWWCRE